MSWVRFIPSFLNSAREWICKILDCDSSAGKSVKIRGDKNNQIVDSHDNTASNGGTVNITYNITNHNYDNKSVSPGEENSITGASFVAPKNEALKSPIKEAGKKKLRRTDESKKLPNKVKDNAKIPSDLFKNSRSNKSR